MTQIVFLDAFDRPFNVRVVDDEITVQSDQAPVELVFTPASARATGPLETERRAKGRFPCRDRPGGKCSTDPLPDAVPDRTVRCVFEDDAAFRQLLADRIGASEIAAAPRRCPLRDQSVDLGIGPGRIALPRDDSEHIVHVRHRGREAFASFRADPAAVESLVDAG